MHQPVQIHHDPEWIYLCFNGGFSSMRDPYEAKPEATEPPYQYRGWPQVRNPPECRDSEGPCQTLKIRTNELAPSNRAPSPEVQTPLSS